MDIILGKVVVVVVVVAFGSVEKLELLRELTVSRSYKYIPIPIYFLFIIICGIHFTEQYATHLWYIHFRKQE